MNNLLQTVQLTIETQKLLQPGEGVLVGLSGGADSVCLLSALLQLRDRYSVTVYAAHLHHGLRGSEADADEAFVRNLCKEKDVPLFVRHADIRTEAQKAKIGLEEAGRKARYLFFEEIRTVHGLQKIATAHHADDNIETVLMRFLRGTGPLGLGGIPYQNGVVIRPLLDVSRADIEGYLQEQRLTYRTDSTNFETEFTRNRIRHRLIPMLEQDYNPNFRHTLKKQIQLYAVAASFLHDETERHVQELAQKTNHGYCLDCKRLLAQPEYIINSVLHRLITSLAAEACGMTAVDSAKAVLQSGHGSADLSKQLVATACYGSLYIRKKTENKPFAYPILPQGSFTIPETGQRLTFTHVAAVPAHPAADCAYIKPDMLRGKTVYVRSRKEGDVFYPTGMKGKKTIKKFFTDAKIPQFMRDTIPLLTVGDTEIIWIAGQRVDRRFAAEEGAAALCVKFYEGDTNESVGK